MGGQNKLDFKLKLQGNCCILWIDIMPNLKILDILLENKISEKEYKKCFKKIGSWIGIVKYPHFTFDIDIYDFHFFTELHQIYSQSNILGVCSILAKKLTNFDPPKSEINNLTGTSTYE